jgi:trimeric autotransporter adhesin
MSTKTTFKRIALVAVASLGFGVLTSVAPANAAALTATGFTIGTTSPARVGVYSTTPITVTHAAGSTANADDTITVGARVLSAPVGSTVISTTNSSSLGITFAQPTNGLAVVNTYAAGGASGVITQPNTTTVKTSSATNLRFVPDLPGTYTIFVFAGSTYTAGQAGTSYTITTAGAPTSMTLASVIGAVVTGGTDGQILSATFKDAAGNATVLGPNESVNVSTTDTTISLPAASGVFTGPVIAPQEDVAGTYYVQAIANGTVVAGSSPINFTGAGLLPTSLTANVSATKVVATTNAADVVACTTAANCVTTGSDSASAIARTVGGSVSVTVTPFTAQATARNFLVKVTNNSTGWTYNTSYAVAADGTSATFTVPAPSTAGTVVVDFGQVVGTFTFGAPVATTLTILGSTSVLSATGGSTTWNVEVDNQYGVGIAFAPVSVAVAGRNTVLTTALGVTDANGIISYTLKDAGTVGTTDTLTFSSTAAGVTSKTATVTYGTFTVSKVSFTGGSTTAGVANVSPTVHAIEADQTPESATQDAVVTVTDAAGNLLAGVPVVFTVSDATKLAVTTTTATVYTGSDGKATAKVFAWIAGTYTVTATAGGVAGTGTYSFANSRAADARVLSASATDGVIAAKVVDRFGNPVSGVTVYASRTSGTGYFGTGVSKTTSTTGVDGVAEFTMIGTAEVLVSTLDYNALPGVNASGQTCALAGNFTCASGATAAVAFTATTAGTSAVNAANVGSSFAPAGVSRVTVSVNNNAAADNATAAADAAAEATDAANAATDAANAAAEAADAATAAAQDAADAVAALSTQVTELVSALRKQITSLTNLVIKIQRKVRA